MCKVVSIIVPVYNVLNYISDCIESLKRQTYSYIEIILVDDGSIDGSAELCDFIQKSDKRIIVFHKTNGGVSSARNYGIERAKGSYLMFVDGDDWLEPNAVELMLKRLQDANVDVCYCNKYYRNSDDVRIATYLSGKSAISAEQVVGIHLQYGFIASPCFSLLCKEKVKAVKFKENIYTLEDWEYNFQVLLSVNRIAILDTAYYHYRSVEGSASKSPLNKRKLSCFKIVKNVQQTVIDQNLPFKDYIYNVPAFLIYHMLVIYAKNGQIDASGKELRHYARRYILQILASSKVDYKYKLYTMMACVNLTLFKVLYLLKNK